MCPFMLNVILFTFNLLCCFNCYSLKYVPEHLQNPLLQIQLPQGKLQGKIRHTVKQKLHYFSFEGIPYAMPPVDDLRFKPPVPADNWDDVLNSTVMDVPSCVQVTPSVFNGFLESEDCLYINVFTPVQDLRNATNGPVLPVMVWIYGGGFLLGSANASYFGPDYLLEENVIVVHFGYRLGPFGFLSTDDMESPGNYGLKDQHLALRWVKDNIQFFGGNPNKITIFGESAGGVSVQYQLMYPKNNGIFQGAISQSGSALCTWAYQRHPRKIAFDLGRAAGIKTNSPKELISYLRSLSTEKLKGASMKASLRNSLGIINGIPFAPTIEPDHEDAFVTSKSHQLLVDGHFLKVPYIIGFNSEEASIVKTAFSVINPLLHIYDFDARVWVPSGMNTDQERVVGEKIRKFYFDIPQSRANQYLQYINDGYFFRPIIESARLFALSTPTYLYTFTYEGPLGRNAIGYSHTDEYKGVLHTEEMAYIWSRNDLSQPSCADEMVRARMVRLWANFAKTGNPTPDEEFLLGNTIWPTVAVNATYLDINKELSVKKNLEHTSMEFWDSLYDRYGKPPYDTY